MDSCRFTSGILYLFLHGVHTVDYAFLCFSKLAYRGLMWSLPKKERILFIFIIMNGERNVKSVISFFDSWGCVRFSDEDYIVISIDQAQFEWMCSVCQRVICTAITLFYGSCFCFCFPFLCQGSGPGPPNQLNKLNLSLIQASDNVS